MKTGRFRSRYLENILIFDGGVSVSDCVEDLIRESWWPELGIAAGARGFGGKG